MKAKTTLTIDETLMRRLKEEAARRGRTMSSLVEQAVRDLLDRRAAPPEALAPLPSWNLGPLPFDVADREAMYEFLEGDRYRRLYGLGVHEEGAGERSEAKSEPKDV